MYDVNARPCQLLFGGSPSFLSTIDAFRGLLDYADLKTLFLRIKGCTLYTEVSSHTNGEYVSDPSNLKPFCEIHVCSHRSFVPKNICERGEHLDPPILAFLNYCVKLRDINLWNNLGSSGRLNAVDGPDWYTLRLRGVIWVRYIDKGLEGFVIGRGMGRVEGYVIRGVEVSGRDFQDERQRQEVIDDRRNLSASSYCQRAIL